MPATRKPADCQPAGHFYPGKINSVFNKLNYSGNYAGIFGNFRELNKFDKNREFVLNMFRMKKVVSVSSKQNFEYPANTSGGEIAARLRAESNPLSESRREALFKQGMQIIYGGTGKKETVGHR